MPDPKEEEDPTPPHGIPRPEIPNEDDAPAHGIPRPFPKRQRYSKFHLGILGGNTHGQTSSNSDGAYFHLDDN